MKRLIEQIKKEGSILGNGILKVDSLINHRVDPELMEECGKEFARLFSHTNPSVVLTAEISGIAPALMTAKFLGIPVVYARKTKPITMPDQVYLTIAPSHTKGMMVELMVSPEYLKPGESVLIIDDFLASGASINALVQLTLAAGAKLVGIGALIEKMFEGGRTKLEPLGIPIESLACIVSMENGKLIFKE